MYSLYKLTVKRTGHYYIGATVNMEIRKQLHLAGVRKLLFISRHDKSIKHPLYSKIAQILVKGKRYSQLNVSMVEDGISFRTILKRDSIHDIIKAETEYIQKHLSDQLCLNTQATSHYSYIHRSYMI